MPITWANASPEWRRKKLNAVQRCRERRARYLKLLRGGKCEICTYDRCLRALEFHHVNPEDKTFAIAGEGHTRSLSKVLTEIAKCVLVCANCHREIEDGLIEVPELLLRKITASAVSSQMSLFGPLAQTARAAAS